MFNRIGIIGDVHAEDEHLRQALEFLHEADVDVVRRNLATITPERRPPLKWIWPMSAAGIRTSCLATVSLLISEIILAGSQ